MSAAENSLRKFLGKPLKQPTRQPEWESQSQSKNPKKPAEQGIPLTFGVELEFILAVLDSDYAPQGYEWLYTPSDFKFLSPCSKAHDPFSENIDAYRAGLYPQLTWTSRILSQHDLPHAVGAEHHTDPHKWGVTHDITVNAFGWDEVQKKLPDRVRKETYRQWDAKGVEAVSRVLRAPEQRQLHADPALAEVRRYLNALHGGHNTPWGVYVNSSCGLHVHVGLDPKVSDTVLPLDVLQHLSYMLVQFETSISALHPRNRRALSDTAMSTGTLIGSNLMGIRQARHVCEKVPLPLLERIQDRIFAEDMSVKNLALLMSESLRGTPTVRANRVEAVRWKFVNFARLVGSLKENGARTIEFRQHGGSVDAEEIGRWVMFVTGLVRAAERLAARSKPASPDSPSEMSRKRALEIHMTLPFARRQGDKYKLMCQRQSDEYERLFNLMEMPRLDREYWMGRYRNHNPEEVLGRDEVLTISEADCPVCAYDARDSDAGSPVLNAIREEDVSSDSSTEREGQYQAAAPRSSMDRQEIDRLHMVWGIWDTLVLEGSSGEEDSIRSPPFRPKPKEDRKKKRIASATKDFLEAGIDKLTRQREKKNESASGRLGGQRAQGNGKGRNESGVKGRSAGQDRSSSSGKRRRDGGQEGSRKRRSA